MRASEVPFFANTPDGTHCFQAALKMVLKFFRPTEDYSWPQMDAITAKAAGVGTWPFAGLTWLHDRGFEVRNIEHMDNRRFALEGRPYLAEVFGEQLAAATPLDLSAEQAAAAKFVDAVHCETRIPSFDDLRELLANEYLAICNVNSRTLNGREGHMGHFVVVTTCDSNEVTFHDPGPPPTPSRRATTASFDRAWAYPAASARNIVAVRPRERHSVKT
jgi:hypothetical protein